MRVLRHSRVEVVLYHHLNGSAGSHLRWVVIDVVRFHRVVQWTQSFNPNVTSRAELLSEVVGQLRVQRGREVAEVVADGLSELFSRKAWVAVWSLRDLSRGWLALRKLLKRKAESEYLQLRHI